MADGGEVLTQSLAIIEYLDEMYPAPPLLPATSIERARVRSIALEIACDIHPLNNLRVLLYLKNTLGLSDEQKDGWYRYWVDVGLEAIETRIARDTATGRFCHGDAPTLADICLVPQLANARRMNIDVTPYPTLTVSSQRAWPCRRLSMRRRLDSRMRNDKPLSNPRKLK